VKLYGYFRSSASYRVRIALNLKGLAPEQLPVALRKGAQHEAGFDALNPQHMVPALATDDGGLITQSLAIVEWLDETHPSPPLLPGTALERARVRSLALAVACDIHPLNNLRVLQYLTRTLNVGDAARDAWYAHWCEIGLRALETRLTRERETGRFCHGDAPTLADVCLVPQLANARRVPLDLAQFPKLLAIEQECLALPAFAAAAPSRQPDAESP
jgi:maleylacetoacetate isomerase